MALWQWPAAAQFLRTSDREPLLLITGAAVSLLSAAIAIWRTREILVPVVAMAAGLCRDSRARLPLLAAAWPMVYAALALMIAEYSARVIVSHLTDSVMPWPDAAGLAIFAVYGPAGLLWLGARALMTWRSFAQAQQF